MMTFYATPDRATIDRWIAQTPTEFKFCLKFPRTITHSGLLMPQIVPAQAFISQMQELGERLGEGSKVVLRVETHLW